MDDDEIFDHQNPNFSVSDFPQDNHSTIYRHAYNHYGNNSESDFVADHPLYGAAMILIKVLFPILVLLGSFANTLVIVLLRRGAINIDNLSFFLSALAVVDTLFLYTSALKTWMRVMWDFELLHMGTWSCKLGLFLNHLSLTLSAWLVVVIAWQRWYTCSRPFDRCCPVESSRCGYIGLACLLLILVGANSYVLFTVKLHETPWGYVCAPIEEYDRIIGHIFPYILMALYSGLPALLLVILNSLLARVLYLSRRSLLSHEDSARINGRNDNHVRTRYNYVTALLMSLAVSWFLLTTPHTLLKLVERRPENSQQAATQMFLNVLFFVFLYINHSMNFFLYCALTRGFRREVKKLTSMLAGCLTSLSHCCYRQCCPRSKETLDSSTSINNGRSSNIDSAVPLLEYNRTACPRVVTHNCYDHACPYQRGRTCV